MIVVTLLESGPAGLRTAIAEFDDVADAYEIRLDALGETPEPARVRGLTSKPLIATCRRAEDGGTWRGSEAARLALLASCVEAGFDHVDVEEDTAIAVPETRLIRSIHAFDEPPKAPARADRLTDLAGQGATAKYAGRARSFVDTLALLRLARDLTDRAVVAAVMGLGDFPRPLCHLLGARFLYGGGRRNAPYQPAARDLAETLDHWGRPQPAGALYLVVGAPVAHSLSPRMHNAALQDLAVDASYGALEVPGARDLVRLLRAAPGLRLRGLSVTAPLKQGAYKAVDVRTPEAEAAQSVNTIRFDEDGTVGHNTDGIGARHAINDLDTTPDRILVLGAGGAARGLLAALDGADVTVAARRKDQAQGLAAAFDADATDLATVARRLDSYALLVNATSVQDPIDLGDYAGALFDLHYAPDATRWQEHAAANGNAFVGGRQLLLAQGAQAFKFWTGQTAPVDTMRRALEVAP